MKAPDELKPRRRERRIVRRRESDVEPVVLTKKLADVIDGIVLLGFRVGDRLCLGKRDAALLIAEGWACPVPVHQRRRAG
jgi:hypothetical protein